jgi:hypothetical protein
MGGTEGFFDRWSNRLANYSALLPLVPASAFAVIAGYLSTGVQRISQFGAFGWFTTGFITFVLSGLAFAMFARARLWWIDARNRARLMSDSSPFDPMARVYEEKRLFLRDLAPVGRRQVFGKKFINCEIIGPGTALIGLRSSETRPFPKITDSRTYDVDCIQVDPTVASNLAIAFPDCDFEGCGFYHMTLLASERTNETLHWITPRFDEPRLIPDNSDAQNP